MTRIQDFSTFNAVREAGLSKLLPSRPRIGVGMGTCGTGNGAEGVYHAFAEAINRDGRDVQLASVGCFGFCAHEPLVNVWLPGEPLVILHRVEAGDVPRILDDIAVGKIPEDLALCKIEHWDHLTAHIHYGEGFPNIPDWHDIPFFKPQKKIVLRNCGLISPDDIEEYIAIGGYQALYKVLIDANPELVIEQIKASKLRGRGGAGFLTGLKWEFLRKAQADRKYIVCNADEGDPGAYMNRNEIESDPHALLEGMIIGALRDGRYRGHRLCARGIPAGRSPAHPGHRPGAAIRRAGREHSGARLQFRYSDGGRRGRFRVRRGDGADRVARRLRRPAAAAAAVPGAEGPLRQADQHQQRRDLVQHRAHRRQGAGVVQRDRQREERGDQGLLAGGQDRTTPAWWKCRWARRSRRSSTTWARARSNGRSIKSVQTGGPSGGCIPRDMFDTPVDYETLAQIGSIMGSGGMVVMDEDNCMVDVARYFIEFTHSESCGKCIPCRVGLDKSLRILNAFTRGRAKESDLDTLDEMGRMIRDTSLCGLGQTAPNPVLTTMRHFRHEFEDHIRAHRCRAGVCEELALSPCENSCPLHMNIPRFLQLYKEGRLEDAFESVVLDNPLPGSTGRVCQHPCDDRCRRRGSGRSGEHARSASLYRGFHLRLGPLRSSGGAHRSAQTAADGAQGGGGRRRAHGPHRRVLSGDARP